jgi:DNA-binding transcriptional regulator YiaG
MSVDEVLIAEALDRAERRGEALPPPLQRRAIRQARNLTQQDMAELVVTTRESISRWESGREPRGQLRRRYAAVLEALLRV